MEECLKALCKYTTLYKIVEYSWRRKPKAIYSYGCSPETTAPQILGEGGSKAENKSV